mmetsp:Transcript_15497/g.38239  ORF Transcript_15497/g.38239 Transcript_15497/m.38239 type:complete len:206 (-) Transcript_15497:970-1587(-)
MSERGPPPARSTPRIPLRPAAPSPGPSSTAPPRGGRRSRRGVARPHTWRRSASSGWRRTSPSSGTRRSSHRRGARPRSCFFSLPRTSRRPSWRLWWLLLPPPRGEGEGRRAHCCRRQAQASPFRPGCWRSPGGAMIRARSSSSSSCSSCHRPPPPPLLRPPPLPPAPLPPSLSLPSWGAPSWRTRGGSRGRPRPARGGGRTRGSG